MKDFGVSPVSNRIQYGTVKNIRPGVNVFTGTPEDVTDKVLAATFEWFENNIKDENNFSITYDNSDYRLVMMKKNKE